MAWLGSSPGGHPGGAPAYDPTVLLGAWLNGFMTGVRSCRTLAAACDERLPFLWLTGGQRPDHSTRWRFYERHRGSMQGLFRRTVATVTGRGIDVVGSVGGYRDGATLASCARRKPQVVMNESDDRCRPQDTFRARPGHG